MGRVDRCLLRLATLEILLNDDIPINVSIDEAIELAKAYGSENSPTFINGVLDRVAANLKPQITIAKVPARQKEKQPEVAAGEPKEGVVEENSRLDESNPEDWRLL